MVSVNFVLGLLTLILQFFRSIFEAIDRAIYAVDEGLRFREGQNRGVLVLKAAFGAVWFLVTYVFRFAWNLLVEPQINPIKHFPVVTVSHKLLLPLIPSLAKQFRTSKETMGTIVFGIPGIFGFLVWELKENWKLYRANSSPTIRPAIVGGHGETVRALLRPGFHSGVAPKTFAKLRRAIRAGDRQRAAKYHHGLEHVGESVQRLIERTVVPLLRHARARGGKSVAAGHPILTPNQILIPLKTEARTDEIVVALEERGGWIIASIGNSGWLPALDDSQRAVFVAALTGLYKLAGVHAVREQVVSVFGEQAYFFDAVPEGLLIPMPDGKDAFRIRRRSGTHRPRPAAIVQVDRVQRLSAGVGQVEQLVGIGRGVQGASAAIDSGLDAAAASRDPRKSPPSEDDERADGDANRIEANILHARRCGR